MASSRGIHWATPAMMASGLIAGCLLCLGHHLFYAGLAGTTAPTGEYDIAGTNISKQKFNTAVGTAFAFLIKAALALVVSIAYIQAFWRSARNSKTGQRLSTLDTMFSVLGNVLNLTKLQIWVKYPLLLLMAVIAWYVRISFRRNPYLRLTHSTLGLYPLLQLSHLQLFQCKVSSINHRQWQMFPSLISRATTLPRRSQCPTLDRILIPNTATAGLVD